MPNLVWGQFKYDARGKTLLSIFSGQSIRWKSGGRDRDFFDYIDGETRISIAVERRPWGRHVDFGEIAAVRQSYGLWRRLAFFLPDSLACWFFGGRTPYEPGVGWVTLGGGGRTAAGIRQR